jgi:hypothetical protein
MGPFTSSLRYSGSAFLDQEADSLLRSRDLNIFVVNLAAYDKVLSEDPSQNTMMESLMLFDSVVNSPWLRRASIILFLNNVSHFKQKVADSPPSDYFPDYSGDNDVNSAANYILSKFIKANWSNLRLYPHFTESGDAANLGHVYDSVRDTCTQNNIDIMVCPLHEHFTTSYERLFVHAGGATTLSPPHLASRCLALQGLSQKKEHDG